MKKLSALLLALCLVPSVVVCGESGEAPSASQEAVFRLHSLFQSNMVLQRDSPIVVWGWADAGETVTVSFGGKEASAESGADRSWKVTLPPLPASSEPRAMVVKSRARTWTLDNVLVGDVWVIGGQSNMQHPLSRVQDGPVEIASANFPAVRLLTVPPMIDDKVKTNFPRREKGKQPDGDWDVCSPSSVREFSAIGYIFGRRLHMASQVPMGLIDISRWGTTVEAWTPLAVLEGMETPSVKEQLAKWKERIANYDPQKDLEQRIQRYNRRRVEQSKDDYNPPSDLRPGPQVDQNHPGNCYNSFVAPIAGLAVKGAIYHQGFNNARPDAAEFYHAVFPRMINSWRAAFQDPKMAFGIISLCTDGTHQTLENYAECMMNFGIYVREAQYKTFLDFHKAGDSQVGFASSFDLRRAWYHPQHKIPAGERIARWALATQYGFGNTIRWKPPMVTGMEVKDGTILLHLDSGVSPECTGDAIVGFAVAGEDRKYQPATAHCLETGKDSRGRPQLDRTVLVLRSPHVPEPVHYRYAWGRNPMGNLRSAPANERDIPFATQRSDDWAFWEVPYLEPPADKGESRQTQQEIREILRFVDLERRVKDARLALEEEAKHYEAMKEKYQ